MAAVEVRVVITDAPPLITLAVAGSLDYLLYPGLPVIIPDAVFFEATATGGRRALLLSDDRDAERLVVVDPRKLILLTTWDYLRVLEAAQRIQSADAVMTQVRAAGRNPPQRDLWSRHDPEIRDVVQAILSRPDPRPS